MNQLICCLFYICLGLGTLFNHHFSTQMSGQVDTPANDMLHPQSSSKKSSWKNVLSLQTLGLDSAPLRAQFVLVRFHPSVQTRRRTNAAVFGLVVEREAHLVPRQECNPKWLKKGGKYHATVTCSTKLSMKTPLR